MNDPRSSRPNEWLYIPLKSMVPYVVDLDIPKAQMKREINKIEKENNASSMPEVIFNNASGDYLVVGGYTTFYAYAKVANPNRLIPCKAFYELQEDEKYLLTLDWMMKNRVDNWYSRHKIITKLIVNFAYTEKELASFLNKEPKDIKFYLASPANIQTEAIRQGKESIINKIYLTPFKNNHNKDYLYINILYLGQHVTDDQLKFIGWMRGNGINFEERGLTLEQEHQLIDRALNLKDDFLNDIRVMINIMRMSNRDDPIFNDPV